MMLRIFHLLRSLKGDIWWPYLFEFHISEKFSSGMKKNKANKQTNKRVFMLKVQGPQN